jgi:hypothetical protein
LALSAGGQAANKRELNGRYSKVYPPPELRTSQAELLGTTTGMILTAVVAILGLAVLLGMVFLADGLPPAVRSKIRRGGASGRRAGEISDGQGDRPWEQLEDRHVPAGGQPHGKPASWVLVTVVMVAALVGGLSIIAHIWWLLWACIAIAVLAIPAGKMIGIMDDTVDWGSTSDPQSPGPEAARGRDHPAQIR